YENHMIIHIHIETDDFDLIYLCLKHPTPDLSLGKYEDILDIERFDIVNINFEEQVEFTIDMYVPIDTDGIGNRMATIYTLTKEYEITKQGFRRWKKNGGRIKTYYLPSDTT